MAAGGFDGEPMTLESLAGMVISALLMVYLVYAMLRPEDF
jgi:K+-transporting ATPase KdpF subunit